MINNQNDIRAAIKDKFWAVYDSNTTRVSNILRQLAFAEGGICWFYISSANRLIHSNQISLVLVYLVSFFICDAMQYLASSLIYFGAGLYYEHKNNKNLIKHSNDVGRKKWMATPPLFLFILKLTLIGMASYYLIPLLLKLNPT